MTPVIVLGLPTYDGTRSNTLAVIDALQSGFAIHYLETSMSLLSCCFNSLLAQALNLRSEGATHFVLLHADVEPEAGWLLTLIRETETVRADLLAAVVPMKIAHGDVSTAIDTDDPWQPRRLSRAEVMMRPVTWTEPGLLVNTGCMVLRLSHPSITQVAFHMHDRIVQQNGHFVAECIPEDWDLSRQMASLPGTVYATRAIRIRHGQEVFGGVNM